MKRTTLVACGETEIGPEVSWMGLIGVQTSRAMMASHETINDLGYASVHDVRLHLFPPDHAIIGTIMIGFPMLVMVPAAIAACVITYLLVTG